MSDRDRRLTAPELTKIINSTKNNSHVSVWTVRRVLTECGLDGRVARKKPLLSALNIQQRIRWCKSHRHWSSEDWKRVLWTDESSIELFSSSGRVYVRRRRNERLHPKCLVPTVKKGGGRVSFWGCFVGDDVGLYIAL